MVDDSQGHVSELKQQVIVLGDYIHQYISRKEKKLIQSPVYFKDANLCSERKPPNVTIFDNFYGFQYLSDFLLKQYLGSTVCL